MSFNFPDLKSPLLLVLDITNNCNITCKYCFQNLRGSSTKDISIRTLEEILREAKDLDIFDINICGGEPFTHPHIVDIIKKIKNSGFGISLVTNATLINKNIAKILFDLDVIKNIQVSFDGHNKILHNKTRSDFSRTLTGFLNIAEKSKSISESPSIGIVVSKYNYMKLDEMINYFSKYTRRFHLMNLMFFDSLSLDQTERLYFINKIVPKIKTLADKKNLWVSILKNKESINYYELQNVHIDCLAGYTSLVISADLSFYPCDVAPIKIGEWAGYGSLKENYEKAKKYWLQRKNPWCYDVNSENDKICCMAVN